MLTLCGLVVKQKAYRHCSVSLLFLNRESKEEVGLGVLIDSV